MRLLSSLSLRARLAIALTGVAVLAVGFATVLGNLGLGPRLNEAAHSRLQRSADHFAEVTATVYRDSGGWTPAARQELTHLATLDGLRVAIEDESGLTVDLGPPPAEEQASAPLVVGDNRLGTVVVSATSGLLLTPEESNLRHSLDRLHLAAGGAAILAALLVAFLLAQALSRPLRRIRLTAERVEQGDLAARVKLSGDPEVRSVGRALNRLAETLEHEEGIRKASVADLAHELRTPVNGLLARLEAAQDGILAGPENLDAMHAETLRLARLLDDLARLAEAERPGLLIEKRVLDLAELGRREADTWAPLFVTKEIEFSTQLEPVAVLGDGDRLGQVVSNLLSNALRYSQPGGRVDLRVRREETSAVLEVADTGVGIAPEDLKHVFKRFWRGERSRSRATGGAGIGLAIVYELVRAHDGRIDVESRPGAGSTFRVSLPVLDTRGLHGNGRRASPDLQTPARP